MHGAGLSQKYRDLLRWVEDFAGGEAVDPETGEVMELGTFYAELAAVEGAIEDRVDGAAALIRALKASSEHLHAEEKRLRAIRERMEAASVSARDLVRTLCEAAGGKVKTPTTLAYLGAVSESVDVMDPAAVPMEYRKEPPPDVAAIRKALKDGKSVPGAVLVRGNRALIIK